MTVRASLIILLLALVFSKAIAPLSVQAQEDLNLNILPCVNPEITRNPLVEKAILEWFKIGRDDQIGARYYYNKVDLNGDGDPEVIVYLVGDYVCGSGGCDTLILQRQGRFFSCCFGYFLNLYANYCQRDKDEWME